MSGSLASALSSLNEGLKAKALRVNDGLTIKTLDLIEKVKDRVREKAAGRGESGSASAQIPNDGLRRVWAVDEDEARAAAARSPLMRTRPGNSNLDEPFGLVHAQPSAADVDDPERLPTDVEIGGVLCAALSLAATRWPRVYFPLLAIAAPVKPWRWRLRVSSRAKGPPSISIGPLRASGILLSAALSVAFARLRKGFNFPKPIFPRRRDALGESYAGSSEEVDARDFASAFSDVLLASHGAASSEEAASVMPVPRARARVTVMGVHNELLRGADPPDSAGPDVDALNSPPLAFTFGGDHKARATPAGVDVSDGALEFELEQDRDRGAALKGPGPFSGLALKMGGGGRARVNAVSEPDASSFLVRGTTYFTDHRRQPAGRPPTMRLIAADWHTSEFKLGNVAAIEGGIVQRRLSAGGARDPREGASAGAPSVSSKSSKAVAGKPSPSSSSKSSPPFLLVLHLQLPPHQRRHLSLTLYFEARAGMDPLTRRFLYGLSAFRDARLKIIPKVHVHTYIVKILGIKYNWMHEGPKFSRIFMPHACAASVASKESSALSIVRHSDQS